MPRILNLILAVLASTALAQDPPNPIVWKGIELEWEAVPKAAGYEVRLTSTAGGKPHLFETVENHLNQQVPVGNYKLQIRARDKDGEMSPWSAASDFEVVVKEIIPLHPEDKATIEAEGSAKQPVEFKWTPVDKVRIYTLKVWSEDKKDTPWIFTGRFNKKTLEVPPGRVYYWQVIFESATDVSYQQEPKTFSFTLQGTQLLKPEIKPYAAAKDLFWKGSEETKAYKTKLFYRHLDETEWTLVAEKAIAEDHLSMTKMKAGNYKLEVIATAPRRLSSVPATSEFFVKPTVNELAQAVRLSLQSDSDSSK